MLHIDVWKYDSMTRRSSSTAMATLRITMATIDSRLDCASVSFISILILCCGLDILCLKSGDVTGCVSGPGWGEVTGRCSVFGVPDDSDWLELPVLCSVAFSVVFDCSLFFCSSLYINKKIKSSKEMHTKIKFYSGRRERTTNFTLKLIWLANFLASSAASDLEAPLVLCFNKLLIFPQVWQVHSSDLKIGQK